MFKNAAGDMSSVAVWTRTVPTLLPHADLVAFVDMDRNAKPTTLGTVPWDRVMSVCGSHLTRDGHSPPRWAIGEWFPSTAELAKLAPSRDPVHPADP